MAKTLILLGAALIISGLIYHFFGGSIPFGKLPGDIQYKSGNTKVFIPITSCIVISALLSFIMWIFKR
ncbi:MAG: DUF2905 domain-containing protein [Bacteriovoracaceae bacterium]